MFDYLYRKVKIYKIVPFNITNTDKLDLSKVTYNTRYKYH